jgi:hypothetical protein
MSFTFIWFIFTAYSVSGYHKTFLTFSNIYKCSMKVITAQLCGQPPPCPICSPESDQTASQTFFVSCFPPPQWQHLQVQMNTEEEEACTHAYHNNEGNIMYCKNNGNTATPSEQCAAQKSNVQQVEGSGVQEGKMGK